jgi:hypothetical protein
MSKSSSPAMPALPAIPLLCIPHPEIESKIKQALADFKNTWKSEEKVMKNFASACLLLKVQLSKHSKQLINSKKIICSTEERLNKKKST